MHKSKSLLMFLPVALLGTTLLSGCGKKEDVRVLRILNCEDYIYEYLPEYAEDEMSEIDMVDQFKNFWENETGEKIDVVYDTFDTNETMFNELQTGKSTYDVIVPSDYMIQKLISNNMLEKISDFSLWDNISPYLEGKFHDIKAERTGEDGNPVTEEVYEYSVPYMWGTIGVMYNPDWYIDEGRFDNADDIHKAFKDWDSLYGEELRGSFSIKDSVRDTYAVSLIHNYRDEIAAETDNSKLTEIFNRHDEDAMNLVKQDMLKLKENAFGFECDSGKTDMTTGKIGANMCWSGDATWAIEEAENPEEEENQKTLYYSIPTDYNGEENKGASNVWFDGFCMPKSKDLQKDLAQAFIKFMSEPENAVQNCYAVGYTPGVAGEAMLDYIYDCYDVRGEVGGVDDPEAEWVEYDLSYFFDGSFGPDSTYTHDDTILHANVDYVGRQLTAQYPSNDMLPRLAIMNDFGTEGNARLLDMWEQVRTNPLPTWAIVLFAVEGVAIIAFGVYFITLKVNRKRCKKERTF